ncbi:MAG: hypothetical protein U0797_14835 [Gemmataceae bacterium]
MGLRDHPDLDARQTFVEVYDPLTIRFARRKGLQEADTAELTQDFLAGITRSGQRFDYDQGDQDDELPAAADGEWASQFHDRVLRTAREQTWQAFETVWLEEKSAVEGLGLGLDHVYVLKSRTLKRLGEGVLHLAEDVPDLAPLNE